MKPIVIFDLDGVIVKNPITHNDNNDIDFWHNHWMDYRKAILQPEMIRLAQFYQNAGYTVVILTARPRQYQGTTELLLRRAGLPVFSVEPDDIVTIMETNDPTLYSGYSFLVMTRNDEIVPSAQWKADVVKSWLDAGLKIELMVEDYKPNAQRVREHIPVLVYERQKKVEA